MKSHPELKRKEKVNCWRVPVFLVVINGSPQTQLRIPTLPLPPHPPGQVDFSAFLEQPVAPAGYQDEAKGLTFLPTMPDAMLGTVLSISSPLEQLPARSPSFYRLWYPNQNNSTDSKHELKDLKVFL